MFIEMIREKEGATPAACLSCRQGVECLVHNDVSINV